MTSDFIAAITGKTAERKKTVAEYLDAWLANAKAHLAHGTIQKYEQLAREFKAHVKADAAPILMEDITADNVREYLTAKRKATTHETTKGFRRILSSIFLQAQNEGQTTRNPVALAKLPKTLTKETGKRAFTLAEVKQLHDKASPFWQWMIRTAFFTGFSLGDLVTLRRVNVDLKQKTISIKRRKTGKPVTVPINDRMVDTFKSLWPAKAEDYFWPSRGGQVFDDRRIFILTRAFTTSWPRAAWLNRVRPARRLAQAKAAPRNVTRLASAFIACGIPLSPT